MLVSGSAPLLRRHLKAFAVLGTQLHTDASGPRNGPGVFATEKRRSGGASRPSMIWAAHFPSSRIDRIRRFLKVSDSLRFATLLSAHKSDRASIRLVWWQPEDVHSQSGIFNEITSYGGKVVVTNQRDNDSGSHAASAKLLIRLGWNMNAVSVYRDLQSLEGIKDIGELRRSNP